MHLIKLAAAVALLAAFLETPAVARDADPVIGGQRLSLKQCGEKYRAAKDAGALGGQKWADFRTVQCGFRPTSPRLLQTPMRAEAARAEAIRRLELPTELAGEFATETPWKARMRTCLKSYRAQKQAAMLFGIRWVERGGGYYSVCSARLRGKTAGAKGV